MVVEYPTPQHKRAAHRFVELFKKDRRVASILLMCSCARGKATKDSCLDLGIIVWKKKNIEGLYEKIESFKKTDRYLKKLKTAGKYSHLDVHLSDGKIMPRPRTWTSGPDAFELEIGNLFQYAVPLYDPYRYFASLRKKWLPYYLEVLRKKRLAEVKKYCLNNLNHIPLYVQRGLFFQAFDRFYKANQEFMQALFIKRRLYPIAYDKWVKEQFYEILKLPKLYLFVLNNIQIKDIESDELVTKAEALKQALKKYT